MKKIVFLWMALLILISGCSKPVGSLTEITMADYHNMIDQQGTFVILFSQTTCSFCKEYKSTLKELMKEVPLDVVYVEVDKEENSEAFDALIMDELTDLQYLPVTVYVEKGKIEDTCEGALEKEQIEIWLNRNGIELEAE